MTHYRVNGFREAGGQQCLHRLQRRFGIFSDFRDRFLNQRLRNASLLRSLPEVPPGDAVQHVVPAIGNDA